MKNPSEWKRTMYISQISTTVFPNSERTSFTTNMFTHVKIISYLKNKPSAPV